MSENNDILVVKMVYTTLSIWLLPTLSIIHNSSKPNVSLIKAKEAGEKYKTGLQLSTNLLSIKHLLSLGFSNDSSLKNNSTL